MFFRILVPLDGSKAAEAALEPAAALARAFHGNLRLVRVCPGPVSLDSIVDMQLHEAVARRERERLEKYLEKTRLKYSQSGLTVVTRLLEEGDAAQRILEEIRADPVDLVVLSSHGRTGVARLLLGSVAEHICRRATCPVLIIRPPKKNKLKEQTS
jgi:nucleotide-binding universal stress UspA family protein